MPTEEENKSSNKSDKHRSFGIVAEGRDAEGVGVDCGSNGDSTCIHDNSERSTREDARSCCNEEDGDSKLSAGTGTGDMPSESENEAGRDSDKRGKPSKKENQVASATVSGGVPEIAQVSLPPGEKSTGKISAAAASRKGREKEKARAYEDRRALTPGATLEVFVQEEPRPQRQQDFRARAGPSSIGASLPANDDGCGFADARMGSRSSRRGTAAAFQGAEGNGTAIPRPEVFPVEGLIVVGASAEASVGDPDAQLEASSEAPTPTRSTTTCATAAGAENVQIAADIGDDSEVESRDGENNRPPRMDEAAAIGGNEDGVISAFLVEENSQRQGRSSDEIERRIRQSLLHDAPLVEAVAVVAAEDDAPEIGASSTNEPPESWPRRNKRTAVIVAVPLVIAVAVIAALATVLSQETAETSPTLPPSPSPPPSICTSERCESIKAVLEPVLMTPMAFEDASSPQGRALIWLADDDALEVEVADAFNLTQRFAVVTLFFATGGGEGMWREEFKFLSGENVCEWRAMAEENLYPYDEFEKGVYCGDDNVAMVFLAHNNLTGTLPEEIGLLPDLSLVNLYDNKISGTIAEAIGDLASLTMLDFSFNIFTGSIPSSLADLHNLKSLALSANALTGTIPPFSNHPRMSQLLLWSNMLEGSIPPSFNNLSSLELLWIDDNDITGSIPLEASLPLTFLSMKGNRLNGTLPSTISKCTNLTYLDLSLNSLSGTLPEELWNLLQLQAIELYQNKLSGTISTSIGNLRHLGAIVLYGNMLNGTLPSSIVKLTSLTGIGFGQNDFTGTIPNDIGLLRNVLFLNLWDNHFVGTIPPSIGNMVDLSVCYLQWNDLTGTVPTSFAQLTSLYWISLDGNSLTGDITFFCNMPTEIIIEADCYGPDPLIHCTCCDRCCDEERVCSPPRGPDGF